MLSVMRQPVFELKSDLICWLVCVNRIIWGTFEGMASVWSVCGLALFTVLSILNFRGLNIIREHLNPNLFLM